MAKPWFALNVFFLGILWIFIYFSMSWVSYRADKYNEDKVFWYGLTSIISITFFLISYFRREKMWSLIYGYLSILFVYFCYNNVFLSVLKDKSDVELNLCASTILVLSYMLSLIIAGHKRPPK